MSTPLQRTTRALLNAQRIAVFAHISPDGDTLGCILALTAALRALGKDATPFAADGVPAVLKGLPGADWVERNTERRDFDLAVVCDAGALNRIGTSLLPVAESAPLMIDIDHHVVLGATFGDIQFLDAKAAATAELIWRVIRSLERATGKTLVTPQIAECLLTGIITDTGSFMFANVRPQTLRLAAELQKHGAIPAQICEQIYTNRSYASQKLLARALNSLQRTEDGKIAWEHVTGRDFEELGATDEDSDGIVNHARDISGVYIGLMFREIPGRKIRVNLRGREGVAVNEIAAVFGGGGHNLAAGCSVDPPLEEAERRVVEEAIRHLNAKGL
ncbi:phosphoesterase RecJ-like protein [Armatimonadota bacterium]|nr:phosphoesterase RecJ-like protein [Armatimonadota bacterium]